MKRTLAIILVFLLSLSLLSCGSSGVLERDKDYEIESEINSLDIKINAADFIIEYGERLAVFSNLKYLSVKEEGGTLKIVDEAPPHSGYTDAELTIQIPVIIILIISSTLTSLSSSIFRQVFSKLFSIVLTDNCALKSTFTL